MKIRVICVLFSFYLTQCFGALTDAPGKVLFTRDYNQPALERWDTLPGEIKFRIIRDMVIANCEQTHVQSWGLLYKLRLYPDVDDLSLAWSSDGKLAVSAESRSSSALFPIKIVDFAHNKLSSFDFPGPLRRLAWNEQGDKLAGITGQFWQEIGLYNVASGTLATGKIGESGQLSGLAWMGNKDVAVLKTDGRLMSFDTLAATASTLGKLSNSEPQHGFLAWNSETEKFVFISLNTAMLDAGMIIYDAKTNLATRRVFPRFSDTINYVAWDSDDTSGNKVDVGTHTGTISTIDIETLEVKEKLKFTDYGSYSSMAQSADGKIAAGKPIDGAIEIWDTNSNILRTYFAKDITKLMHDNKLSSDQAYAQMVMALLFFDLKERNKALKVTEAVKAINDRMGDGFTSSQELENIRDTFPVVPRTALGKLFNISK